jgi:secondary thiamine-phosphate synthase enzyme
MNVFQKEIKLKSHESHARGFHLITEQTLANFPELSNIKTGILHVFIKHTSASLTINENWDPTVRGDFERYINKMVPEDAPYYEHNYEGPDDMPAHIKASVFGSSVQIPLTNGHLNIGTWQGVYLCEHRNSDSGRTLVLTAWGL